MRFLILNGEVYKQCKINNTYYVSRNGNVFSSYSKKIIKQLVRNVRGKKYAYVDIYINGKQRHMNIHRLVYSTWVRDISSDEQVNHRDDNTMNNNISNLYVGDQKENISDCINNRHRVGHVFYLTLYDKKVSDVLTFCPSSNFIEYSGHPCKNRNVSRMFSKNWFKKRYSIIDFHRIKNLEELKGVTTIPDECMEVGLENYTSGVLGNESPSTEAHRYSDERVEEIV